MQRELREDKDYPYMLYTGWVVKYPGRDDIPDFLTHRLVVSSSDRKSFVLVKFDIDFGQRSLGGLTREKIDQLGEFLDDQVDVIDFIKK